MNFKDIHFTWFYIGAISALLFLSAIVDMQSKGYFKKEGFYCGGVVAMDSSIIKQNMILDSLERAKQEQILQKRGLTSEPEILSLGEELFNGNCKQCHAVHAKVVGPALANVSERRTVKWLIKFIKFPQKTIEKGDKYAVALYKQYQQFMPNHDFMTDEEINAILSFVEHESQYVY
ncbi:MAG: cytochrome c [Thermoflexibacter sp.]|jgi:cytochrome c2|nr:cytochrome c [Thermoflexibacter sp.]